MSPASMQETRHIAIIGKEAHRIGGLAVAIQKRRTPHLWAKDYGPRPNIPVTCVVIAERFPAKPSGQQWWDLADSTWDSYRWLLPLLGTPSTALLVAYTPTTNPRSRRTVRQGLGRIIDSLEADASMNAAIDFTINAIELPNDTPPTLIERRLLQFAHQRTTLTSGVVLPIEDLDHQSIVSALAEEAL